MHSMKDDWANMGPGVCIGKLNVKSDRPMPAFPENLRMNNPIRSINGELIKGVQTEHERLVVDAFWFYGYTKDWVVGNIHRVSARTFPMSLDYTTKTIYSVDKLDLFAIIDAVEFSVWPCDELKANITSRIEFIAEK